MVIRVKLIKSFIFSQKKQAVSWLREVSNSSRLCGPMYINCFTCCIYIHMYIYVYLHMCIYVYNIYMRMSGFIVGQEICQQVIFNFFRQALKAYIHHSPEDIWESPFAPLSYSKTTGEINEWILKINRQNYNKVPNKIQQDINFSIC